MLKLASAFNGYAIKASDGKIGTVADLLFDDRSWRMRWLVVETGTWLAERKILLHPVVLGKADAERRELPVALTRTQVQASPELAQHEPVSMQMERHLYDYYGWEPDAVLDAFGGNPISARYSAPPLFLSAPRPETVEEPKGNDPNLRSVDEITGYHILASDGVIGKVVDLLIDESAWGFRYLVVDTGNWWSGKRILLSPHAVKEISWVDRQILVEVSGDQVKASPQWSRLGDVDPDYEKDLRDHYDWPGHD